MKTLGQVLAGFQQGYLEPEFARRSDKFDNRAWLLASLEAGSSIDNAHNKVSVAKVQVSVNPAVELFRTGYLTLAEG